MGDRVLLPGQMYRWKFSVGDGSWFCQRVTAHARLVAAYAGIEIILNGEVFTLVTVDDVGPAELPIGSSDPLDAGWTLSTPRRRWHVVLLRGVLVWFDDAWFDQSELVAQAV